MKLNIYKFHLIGVIALLFLTILSPLSTMAENGKKDSNITLRPWSETPTVLQCGQTYTSADFDVIKSGSMSVSEDGATLEFDNLSMDCEASQDWNDFQGASLFMIEEPFFTIILKGENRLFTNGPSTMFFIGQRMTITGEGSLTTLAYWYDISIESGDFFLENTTMNCQGEMSVFHQDNEESSNIIVRNSRFEGNKIKCFSSLTLEGCEIKIPSGGWFDAENTFETQIKDYYGNLADHFVISTPEDDSDLQLVKNGNFEGSDFSSFAYKKSDAVKEITSKDIVVDNGNRCLKVVSKANAANTWDSQLLIRIPEKMDLSEGIIKISMRVKASRPTTINRSYFNPRYYDYCYFEDMFGEVSVSTEWRTYSGYYRSDGWLYSTSRNLGDENTVILDLNNDQENSIEFYFDDISITLINPNEIKVSDFTFSKQTLLRNKSYSHDDFDEIKSGSFCVSEDGGVLTFDNLHVESNTYTLSAARPFTLVLKGENTVSTSSSVAIKAEGCQNLTITGDGSLTTQSNWIDFFIRGCDVLIDHTTLNCLGYRAFGNNMWATDKIIVNHSTLKGCTFFRIASLTLINSAFVSPKDVVFNPQDNGGTQLYTSEGRQIWNFEIQPVEGDFNNRVSPWAFDDVIIAKGKTKNVIFSMKNDGLEEIRKIAYVISAGGVDTQEKTISLNAPYAQTGDNFSVSIPVEGGNVVGSKELAVTVTKVNGQINTSPNKTVRGVLNTISKEFPRRVVVEEFTGTWCGWCPRGTLGLELLNKEYGAHVITIAVHDGDPMEASSYTLGSSSHPSARVNRGDLTDPYYGNSGEPFGIKELVEEERNIVAQAGIELSAVWSNVDMSAFRIDTKTTFLIDDASSNYSIGFALLEDGMKGSGSGWTQTNYYSGMSVDDDPNLQSITEFPGMITDIEYDHVAVDAWGINEGIEGSIKDIQVDVPQTFSYLCDISANELIQDKSKLFVVAFLFDKRTGKICNAAKTAIAKDGFPTGIEDLISANRDVSPFVHDISGRKVNLKELTKGVYLLNGRKIMVK